MTHSRDYYRVLGVESIASQSQLKNMYHKLAKKYHADMNCADAQLRKWSHEMMVELNAAYDILKDPVKRSSYDKSRSTQQEAGQDHFNEFEMVFIRSKEEAKTVLYDGINQFPFGAPSAELEEECRAETKKLIDKKINKYVRMGFPNEYSMAYLSSAVELAATDAVEKIQEQSVRYNIYNIYFWINGLIALIAAFKYSESFWDGAWGFFWIMVAVLSQYFILSWIARFIARGFKSNLIGLRGVIVNGFIAVLLTVFSAISIFT